MGYTEDRGERIRLIFITRSDYYEDEQANVYDHLP